MKANGKNPSNYNMLKYASASKKKIRSIKDPSFYIYLSYEHDFDTKNKKYYGFHFFDNNGNPLTKLSINKKMYKVKLTNNDEIVQFILYNFV